MVITFKAFMNERRQKKDGTYPIVLRVTVDRKLKEIPLNIYLHQGEWDQGKNRVRPTHPNAKLIAQKVTSALSKLQEIALKFEAQDKVFTVDDIVDIYLNKKDYRPTVIEFGKTIIDKTGREIVPIIYDYLGEFKDGLAVIQLNAKCGFIDKTGKQIVPIIYDSFGQTKSFSDGLAEVKLDGKYGYIDKNGSLIIPCIYDKSDGFKDGLAKVKLNKKQDYPVRKK